MFYILVFLLVGDVDGSETEDFGTLSLPSKPESSFKIKAFGALLKFSSSEV